MLARRLFVIPRTVRLAFVAYMVQLEAVTIVSTRSSNSKRVICWVAIATGGVPVLSYVPAALQLLPPSRINCREEAVDIVSGRIRHSYFLYGFPIYQATEDSFLTKALSRDDRDNAKEAWQKVTVVTPGVGYSPHYAYHLAIDQIARLQYTWEANYYTPEARRECAKRVLQLWQRDGTYSGVERYIHKLKMEGREYVDER